MRWALGILIGLLLALPAAASAATSTSVSVLGGGTDTQAGPGQLFTPAGTRILAQPAHPDGTGGIIVSIDRGAEGPTISITFAPPIGQMLKPGIYDDAVRPIEARSDQAGFEFSDGGICPGFGRFEVKDVAQDPSTHAVARLWVIYESDCPGDAPSVYGEVRFGEPVSDTAPSPQPSIMRRPEDDLGRAQSSQPVFFTAPAGTQFTGATISGANASDFPKGADTCTGKTIAAGATCSVSVAFNAGAAGTRLATLTVTDAAGHKVDVPLQGWVHGGVTQLVTTPDAGYPGGVKAHDYTPGNSRFAIAGTAADIDLDRVTPFDVSAGIVSAEFQPPFGGRLAPGRYTPVAHAAANGSPAAGLDVASDGLSCNQTSGEFTVREATFKPDGHLKTFGADFVQYCDDTGKALRGKLDYRVGDTAAPAPWMAGGTTTSTPPPAPAPPAAPGQSDPCAAAAFAHAKVRTGTKRANHIRGSRKPEVIRAGAGNDVVRAGGGSDCVDGGSGRDRLDGGAGDDVLIGGSGRDVLICGSGADIALVGPGDRTRGCEHKVRVSH